MKKRSFIISLLVSFSFFIACPAYAKRVALVIGNDNYFHVDKLEKAANDAKAVAVTLRELGFEVIDQVNADRRGMDRKLNQLSSKISVGDEVLFFFAGHGISVKGRNYLLPIDIPKIIPGQERSVTKEAFSEDEIIEILRERGAKVSILIIDACRNNPFPKQGTRSVGRSVGLGQRSNPPRNTFVMYSAGIGQEALDRLSDEDANPNSVFTRKLLPLLKTKGLSHIQMAKRLQIEVEQLALTTSDQHQQFPAFYDQVRGDFYLLPDQKNTGKKLSLQLNSEETLWRTIEHSKRASDFTFYLNEFPKGRYSSVAKLKLQKIALLQIPTRPKVDRRTGKRFALVIGNNNYRNVSKINKAVNDAEAVAKSVRTVGFEVILQTNADYAAIKNGLDQLKSSIRPGDEVLFYFAGHGISMSGHNYLLPTDIKFNKGGVERTLMQKAFSINKIIAYMQEREPRVSILILDADNNNPFLTQEKSDPSLFYKQHAELEKHRNKTFILHSTAFGQNALEGLGVDDRDPNSVFTRKLIPLITTPGLSLTKLARRLRKEIKQLLRSSKIKFVQTPIYYDQLVGDFFFVPIEKN